MFIHVTMLSGHKLALNDEAISEYWENQRGCGIRIYGEASATYDVKESYRQITQMIEDLYEDSSAPKEASRKPASFS